MSAPYVAGAIALLLQANPNLTPEEVERALKNSADDLGYDLWEQGAGRLNVKDAYDSLTEGILVDSEWFVGKVYPGTYSKTFTVVNNGSSAALVSLSKSTGDAGDWITLSASSLTIPAKSSATFDAIISIPDDAIGAYKGSIIVSYEAEKIIIPVSVNVIKFIIGDSIDSITGMVNEDSFNILHNRYEFGYGDWVYYTLDVQEGINNLNLGLDWTNPNNNLDLYLFNTSGSLVGSWTSIRKLLYGTNIFVKPEVVSINNPKAGQWTVAVNAWELNTASETFNLTIELPVVRLVSTYTTTPPEIDGVISPDEWTNANAISITLNGFNNPSNTKNGTLYLMNDNSNLYVAVVIPDITQDTDYLMLDFDQGNDHIADAGDEDACGFNVGNLYPYLPTGYADFHWDGIWWSNDTMLHGSGAMSYSDGNYTYEFSKPLNSGDEQDMNLSLGDTVGFRIESWDGSMYDWYRYPQNTVDADTSRWNEWADLKLAKALNQKPIANFTYSPDKPIVNEATTFNASSSYDPDGSIVSYEWDFGDGNTTNTTEEIIKHSYSEAGNYDVTLTVTDDKGATNSTTKIITVYSQAIFDTGVPANPYPSISGTHNGTIKPNHTVIATKLYTYPCEGTGGHTEYARIWNKTWNATATWEGYASEWHSITFDKPVVLLPNKTYNYTIRTGSYPQIHHNTSLLTPNGWINCTQFVDANGKIYDDWIPAIRLV